MAREVDYLANDASGVVFEILHVQAEAASKLMQDVPAVRSSIGADSQIR